MRRRGHPRHPAVLLGEHVTDFVCREFPQARLHHRADDAAAHLVKKAVAFKGECEQRPAFPDVAASEPAHGRFHFVISICRERFKIVLADKQRRGGAEGALIERARDMPGRVAQQRIHRRVVPDEIAVLFADGIETRMETFRGARCGNHPDVLREPCIEGERQFARGHPAFGARHFEMRHHAERMHTGVRPAGTVQARFPRKQFRQRRLHFFLHARAGFLHLPAFIPGAVVGNRQFEFDGARRCGVLECWMIGVLRSHYSTTPLARPSR